MASRIQKRKKFKDGGERRERKRINEKQEMSVGDENPISDEEDPEQEIKIYN